MYFSQQLSNNNKNIIYSSLKVDLDKREYRPIITKLDKNANLLWEKVIGRYEQGFSLFSHWHGITESNQKDGYIIAGSAYIDAPERDTLLSYAVVAKLSTEGDSIWYRNFTSLDSSKAYHTFYDVIPMPTGGYIAAGYDQYLINRPEGEPRFNIIMVRLDEDGLPMTDTSTNAVVIDKEVEVEVYPNPCIDQVYISSKSSVPMSCKIVDSSGSILHSFIIQNSTNTYVLDTNNFSDGMYYLICNTDKKQMAKKLIVVK